MRATASNYATAAARMGKYAEVAEALWKNQAQWAASGKVWETVASVLTLADQKANPGPGEGTGVLAEVQRDMDEGIKSGINSTPSVFLTAKGKRIPLPAGVPSYDLLVKLIADFQK